jgi:hypothetical protein
MTHLSPDELVDVLDGTLASERATHLNACAHCQAEAAGLGAILGEARLAAVPEPSPLFWDHLSARVHDAIGNEPLPARRARWFEWPVLAPVAALALLVIAFASVLPELQQPATTDTTAAVAQADDVIASVDDIEAQWMMVADLVGDLDLEAARSAGLGVPGSADRAVLNLSSSEQQELVRLLNEELKAGS